MPSEIDLARTFSIDRLTVIAIGTIQVTLALPTVRIAIVTISAGVTVWWLERFTAFAATCALLTVTGIVNVVAIASYNSTVFNANMIPNI